MSDPRFAEWLALRRVHDGGLVKSAGIYFDRGRPVPGHLTAILDRLIWTGLVTVADGDPVWAIRCLGLTDAGLARYAELRRQRRRVVLPVPPAEFATRTTDTPDRPGDGEATVGESPDVVIGMRRFSPGVQGAGCRVEPFPKLRPGAPPCDRTDRPE